MILVRPGKILRGLEALALLACACHLGMSAARAGGEGPSPAAKDDPARTAFFRDKVQPILKSRCLRCHGGEAKVRGNLRLDAREAVLKGGDLGPAVSLEKPEESLLLQAIRYQELEMPPSGKLSQAEIDALSRWVHEGLAWPDTGTRPAAPIAANPAPPAPQSRATWKYGPLSRPEVPRVDRSDWTRNPIDAFIVARLESERLEPVAPADRVALIRRVTYDLTGLPPTPAEVDAFTADRSPDAYERLVDRLLASPLRRGLGAALAGPRALRRGRTATSATRPSRSPALSRLRHQGLQ
ncbi:MAG: DUF1549 domain-containing protein [Isosphaeraceae bacterium]